MSASEKTNGRLAAKETLRSNIKEYIRSKIIDGTYSAGDRIVETKLAKELGVSQAPVREAILELSSVGMLEERPYSGTYVRVLEGDEIIDIFETRAYIEEHATKRAAYRITEEDLNELENIILDMEALNDKDIEEFISLDMLFHEKIIDVSGSPSLKRTWTLLRMSEWTHVSAKTTKRSMKELIGQHRCIFEHLKNKDAASAGAYMYLHINGFGRELARYYEAKRNSGR